MKRLTISETPHAGSMVSILGADGERALLKRVTSDGSGRYNTIIIYDEKDEIYEHWDAMYCWEESEKPRISMATKSPDEYIKELKIPSILLDEIKRKWKNAKPFDYKPLVIKNLTEDKT